MNKTLLLGRTEEVCSRPFTSIAHYNNDIALMNYLLLDLRTLIRRYSVDEIKLNSFQQYTWKVHDLERRIVVCDPRGLTHCSDVQIVGFFGDRRSRADTQSPTANLMQELEEQLIEGFSEHPGILSYSSTELVDHYWANLVVHRREDDREQWRDFEVHRKAVSELAPNAYRSVRIHNGRVLNGIGGDQTVLLDCTKYWDYRDSPVWTAKRNLAVEDSMH